MKEGPKEMLLLNAISNNSSLLEGAPTRRVLRHNTSAFQVPFSVPLNTIFFCSMVFHCAFAL